MSNKVKYGLKNVHYAVITENNGTVQYSTPVGIPGAVNITLSASGETVSFYADDTEYYSSDTNNGYDGTLEVALIPDSFKTDVFGNTKDANGLLTENKDDKVKKIALMFEFDGDANKTRYVLYNVKVTRVNMDGTTTGATKEPKTESMTIQARPAIDTGDTKANIEQGEAGYMTFFTAVPLKNAPTNTVASATATFSKGSASDVVIDSTSTDATNKVKNVTLNGSNIGGAYLTINGADVTIASAYLATLDNGTYNVVVEFNKGNAISVGLTVKA